MNLIVVVMKEFVGCLASVNVCVFGRLKFEGRQVFHLNVFKKLSENLSSKRHEWLD